MAKDSDDCEFWLPPQFLTDDDDHFSEFKNNKNDARNEKGFGRGGCQLEFSYGFHFSGANSDLSSPLEGSTETESDEEDYISELTRKVSHSTLYDSVLAYGNKARGLSGSPQSTLCSALGGCECNQGSKGSSRGSPNCTQVSSPPGMKRNEGAWDLLYAAAGEVARMRMMEAGAGLRPNKNGLFVPPRKPSPISVPQRNPSPSLGYHPSEPHLSYQQFKALQATQFEQLKQQQMMKQQQGNGVWIQGRHQLNQNQQMFQTRGRTEGSKPNSLTAWPTLEQSQRQQPQPLQQQPGSGMRAVFLGNPGAKRECAGTGVFLPRRFGAPTETRKKPACSTVLLPDRVVQALNLNLEAMDTSGQSRYNGSFSPDYDAAAALRIRNGAVMAQQRRSSVRPQPVMSQEVRLPQEWTY